MYLIIGGSYQGKLDYALAQTGLPREAFLDGARIEREEIFSARALFSFQAYVRAYLMGAGDKGLEEFADRLKRKNPNLVLISDEIGCGIIPMDREERLFREAAGRTCTLLAERADRVDRVICGIGRTLKG